MTRRSNKKESDLALARTRARVFMSLDLGELASLMSFESLQLFISVGRRLALADITTGDAPADGAVVEPAEDVVPQGGEAP